MAETPGGGRCAAQAAITVSDPGPARLCPRRCGSRAWG